MKKSLLLYLLITAVLLNVFTYMYYSGEVKHEQTRFIKYEKRMTDSISKINSKLVDANYFSLEYNENAQAYFENPNDAKIIQYEKLIPVVINKLMDYNQDPKGNPYTGQIQLNQNKFIINKVKVLNHRWVIADYSDGIMWGEVILKYFVNPDESISFEEIQSVIYPKQRN